MSKYFCVTTTVTSTEIVSKITEIREAESIPRNRFETQGGANVFIDWFATEAQADEFIQWMTKKS